MIRSPKYVRVKFLQWKRVMVSQAFTSLSLEYNSAETNKCSHVYALKFRNQQLQELRTCSIVHMVDFVYDMDVTEL